MLFILSVFFQALEQEMQARYGRCELVCQAGARLVASKHYAHKDISKRIDQLQDMWAKLRDMSAKRKVRLEDSYESQLVSLTSLHR